MKEVIWNGNRAECFDSIEEFKMKRYNVYNRNVLIDAGLGSDLDSVDKHILAARKFNSIGEKEKCDQVLRNMRINISFILSNTSPKHQAFAACIKTLNGRELTDFSESGVLKIVDELAEKGLTIRKINGFLSHVKKKMIMSFRNFFQRQKQVQQQTNITQN